MTNKNTERSEERYREALLAVLQSTTAAEIPADLAGDPNMVRDILIDRFKTLSGADESTASLMELGAELAARGDRWKRMANMGRDVAVKHAEDPLSKIFQRELAKAEGFPASEQLAHRVSKAFKDAVAKGVAATPEAIR